MQDPAGGTAAADAGAETVTVVGTVRSRAFRVLWLLEEAGLPHVHVPAYPRSAEAVAANPAGKVPVLLAEGAAITDSTAILHYLADRHGLLTHPAGTLARARQDSLTHFLLDELDSVLWTAARHSFVLPAEWRVPEVKASLRWEFDQSLGRLAGRLGPGPFLAGEAITVPDIIAGHCLHWAAAARFPAGPAPVQSYAARLAARPAWAAVMAREPRD
ncbi:MAG: glutathione S-transferase family protein [Rhodobacteraceae bacterium]|jgi:glutathione S-transferase|nr:glutathione S-transferase family protein [Paracoccaceae bacterium]